MSVIRARRWTTSIWVQAILATAVLALALGLCAFEAGHSANGHHGMSLDLCTGLLLVLSVGTVLVRPLMTGWAMLEPLPIALTAPIQLLEPPPRIPLF